jgi:DNA replication protein DnaC
MLSLPEMKAMTFEKFQMRQDEIGKEAVTTVITEKQDKFGNKYKDKEIIRIKVTKEDVKTLDDAHSAAARFSEEPHGWLVFLGQSFCGKTHLAAAIGNYRIGLGGQALLVEVSSLLDYMRQTFRPSSEVSFDRRFHEIRTTPLLILDDLKDSGASSVWAEDKLYSVLNYRYNAHLPTVITSTMRAESFALSYPNLWNKLLDPSMSQILVIDMPPYRRVTKGSRTSPHKKK